MQLLIKVLMVSLYAEEIRKDIEVKFSRKSENWMYSEYDERVKDFCKTTRGN